MRIDVITIHPELLKGPFDVSIIHRAKEKGLAEIYVHNLRDYSTDKHKKVDDYAFGGEAGMVMCIEPIDACISYLKNQRHYDEIIYMCPDGELLNQPTANQLSILQNIIILAGHYKGIDERARELFITKEISIGDYVLTGGELPAAILCDAIIRLIPGVLNDESSALTDSFQDGLLSAPVYTRPAQYKGLEVPKILLSGNFKEIEKWKMGKSIERTKNRRPDLLD
ncbi:MAG: tRNA (guanosine(37)-N1)-methyltransferase TrmD [Bacteroidetes bacterium]|nr:tRNA (guanosine(37)-N1)-methyltransferase TrmD [Bacteroidota bacterium]MBV6461981.1 tRNA (guanine-N(1)-)-methyltransferase [Flavobacteriales bacterium]WKZ76625.1 MAG: tRNA (guanosine(37)-N1)-methyltransferase TrmD [Vicingaceae bacterium]MCL4815554.1 tRNA (guanosine(37)-N1)-methyltransferase TrmD [Flavobacteriales bacterium]NOG94307.1 tRNA (guanosine(37)-N1)-methyltransferase TrmD [Bacteroidota bacterium]